ncbi:MAG TPA: ketoacyl-ACP synthase III [Thermoanaerobaculia bacterium]|nr:ketoacyl-ACP synthase III [Thermoanaerobaculia bacterium]
MIRSVIAATGSHIPSVRVPNEHFLGHDFRGTDQKPIGKSNEDILKQFEAITGIRERRYAPDAMVTTDLAYEAARDALESSHIDPESLDGIIVAHNFGDVRAGTARSDLVPALAARVKSRLGIRNPYAPAFDLVFGCPGWLQGVIVADSMIRAGDNQRVMVIGADTLSRISDPHDRDSLIYADGAGAVIVERGEGDAGILSRAVRSDTLEHAELLFMGSSYHPEAFLESLFLKMEGRKLYKYALSTVAGAIKEALQRANVDLRDVKKVLIHQANGKMDEAILDAVYGLYGIDAPPPDVMPMTISWLGNSSVATVPTLLDLILKGRMEGHTLVPGDVVVFASVGAGMHINAVIYRF